MASDRTVLIVGSAADATICRDWAKEQFRAIVAINNAWRVREDWDYLVFPDDFPFDRRPDSLWADQTIVTSREFVGANNRFGGIFYAGGTMAFTAGYWALAVFQPAVLAFVGCDMIYQNGSKTHFYGKGTADPLRDDPSLRNLEAKSSRLMLHAARVGTACVRMSSFESRLVFPHVDAEQLQAIGRPRSDAGGQLFDEASASERRLGYYVDSGRYWETESEFSLKDIDALDAQWTKAAELEAGMRRSN